jgi:hypothetical protein
VQKYSPNVETDFDISFTSGKSNEDTERRELGTASGSSGGTDQILGANTSSTSADSLLAQSEVSAVTTAATSSKTDNMRGTPAESLK